MRLVLVCSEYPLELAGGQGRAVRSSVELLRAAGHEVRVVGIYPEALRGRLKLEDGVSAVWQKSWPQAWRWSRRQLYGVVRGWAQAGEIDLVEVPFSRGWIANWGPLPVPVAARVHGSFVIKNRMMGNPVPKRYERIEQRALLRADAVSAVSQTVADDLRTHFGYAGAIARIANPVVVPAEGWEPASPRRVVFAGRLSRQKGLDLLLAAWPAIAAAAPDAELHLYGQLDDEELLAAALKGESGGRIRHHGQLGHGALQSAFREAGVAVFPSRYEAFGLAQAEAMANGCPVVVSSQGAGAELVEDGTSGLVCRPLSATTLGQRVSCLLADDVLAERCSRAARERIGNLYAPARITAELLAFYEQTIAAFKGAS